jgi:hypothetical protein
MNQLRSAVRPTGLNSKRTESPRNATPITTPTKLAWAKIRTAAPIAAASNQSDLIGAFFHRLTPFPSVYAFSADPRRADASRWASASSRTEPLSICHLSLTSSRTADGRRLQCAPALARGSLSSDRGSGWRARSAPRSVVPRTAPSATPGPPSTCGHRLGGSD